MTGGVRLAFYGDDFTGSTDALEGLARGGVRCVLFLGIPSSELLARYSDREAIGIAGCSRALSPESMELELSQAFSRLRDLKAPVVHYKVCSTFDSSPLIGSIGKAVDVGRSIFGRGSVAVMQGVPQLGRYVAFGNLFARFGGDGNVYRLDRHPVMRSHPTTPMWTADLREHLAQQCDYPSKLFDFRQFGEPNTVTRLKQALLEQDDLIVVDCLNETHLSICGRALAQAGSERPLFVVGSSGVEYALIDGWQDLEKGCDGDSTLEFAGPADAPVPVVSGSCSTITGEQIEHAIASGFVDLPVSPEIARLGAGDTSSEQEILLDEAKRAMSEGRSVIIHSAIGPNDPRVKEGFPHGGDDAESGQILGKFLGRLLRRIQKETGVSRVAIAGGDTSSFAAAEMGIEALEVTALIDTGAPLCRTLKVSRSELRTELALKGGQMGAKDYFVKLRDGVA